MPEQSRRRRHRRNEQLEGLLADLNRDLAGAVERLPAGLGRPQLPSVFVVGCPRSGTTLMYQWLAATGLFTYPTNFVSRFPAAPWIGERIQLLLTDPDYDFHGELAGTEDMTGDPFSSRLGKTTGLLSPHEFWYWWRRFLPERDTHALSPQDLAAVDTGGMLRELAAWEAVRHRPLAMKGLILNWNLPWLADLLPGAVFVHIRRDPFFTMQSLLAARRDFSGDIRRWYSFRPPQYPDLANREPAQQVAGQVLFTEQAVSEGLAGLPAHRVIQVAYEDFCRDPQEVHTRLLASLAAAGYPVTESYTGPDSFPVSGRIRVSAGEKTALEAAWETLSAEHAV